VLRSSDLAADGPVLADAITGPLIVGGEILDDITVGSLGGDIVCENLRNLTMHSECEIRIIGRITCIYLYTAA